jgi:small subunit ribosomal protein S21
LEIGVDDHDIEKAIRLLKRKRQNDGLFRELKNRRFYGKPSIKKKGSVVKRGKEGGKARG